MANIIDYIQWRGDLGFTADAFNAVDSLILARLAYIDFDDLSPQGESLGSISVRYLDSEEKMNPGLLLKQGTRPLLEATGTSKRFGSVIVKSFINKVDLAVQLQFSAVTFALDDGSAYIAFRGTDDTLVGWKEDFNMSFMDVVPAQTEAESYLHAVMVSSRSDTIYVGGHSKGGNLAVYAAVKLPAAERSRIVAVYNHDGPGFQNEMINTPHYRGIADRIHTLIPKSSVVGLLLEYDVKFRVVDSTKTGLMQHDGFSWVVKGKDFVYLPQLKGNARMLDRATKRMLEKMSLEKRAVFTNVLFDLLSINESKTLTDLSRIGIGALFKMSANYRKLDGEMKKVVTKTLSLFFDEWFRSFLEVTELNQWRLKLKAWQKETKEDIEAFIKKL